MRRVLLAPLLTVATACGTLAAYDVNEPNDDLQPDVADADADADADSDADTDSDADADSDADTDTDPIDTGPTIPCGNFPNESDPALSPANGTMNPKFMGIYLNGIVDQGNFQDYALWDVAGGASVGERSAQIVFEFMDAVQAPLCVVTYDLTTVAGSPGAWVGGAPVALFGAWDLTLTGAQTNCQTLAASFPNNTAPQFIQSFQWNIGFGTMSAASANGLRDLVNAGGGNWAQDYEPYVFSMYVLTDVFGPEEISEFDFVFEFERTCENLHTDATGSSGVVLPVPAGVLTGYLNARPSIVVEFNF